jgi:hypothetical protein
MRGACVVYRQGPGCTVYCTRRANRSDAVFKSVTLAKGTSSRRARTGSTDGVMNRERWRGTDKSTSPSRLRLCRRQAALHGASGVTHPQTKCPQRHRATKQCLIQWRVTELYGARWRRRRRRCREDRVPGSDRLEDWKFRDCECADTAYVGARRPCTALLGHRVRKWNARDVIARPITT